ncbi:MAG: GIY-YIG nuclease family protein [Candidatus Paceibacterota bacterium]
MFYIYVLKSLKDNELYIGSTSNLKRRFVEHNAGDVKSTKPGGLSLSYITRLIKLK